MSGQMYACMVVPVVLRPYAETEEFGCVGVLMYCPGLNWYGYRLAKSTELPFQRVCRFFREIDSKIFRDALKCAHKDIEDMIQCATEELDPVIRTEAFRNLIRPRENFIRYGSPRSVLASDMKSELAHQYEVIVQRSFVDREGYYEQKMRQRVAGYLRGRNIAYQNRRFDFEGGLYSFSMPFVIGTGAETRTIKPLNFVMKTPNDTMDHWFKWQKRLTYLQGQGMSNSRILVPFRMPEASHPAFAAASFACKQLRELARTVDEADLAAEKEQVLSFVS